MGTAPHGGKMSHLGDPQSWGGGTTQLTPPHHEHLLMMGPNHWSWTQTLVMVGGFECDELDSSLRLGRQRRSQHSLPVTAAGDSG